MMRDMTDQLLILDLDDAEVFHTNLLCEELVPLLDHAEVTLGAAVDADELLAHAVALGLVVESGVAPGLRWCRACRHEHEARNVRAHAFAA